MAPRVEKVCEPVLLGEGPHWDCKRQALYYVSIQDHTIHKYVPATNEHCKTKLEGRVGFIVPVEGSADQFVVGLERRFLVIQWDGKDGSKTKVVKELAEVEHGRNTRINDAKCDPRGRLYGGTMGHEEPLGNIEPNKGSLYRLVGTTVTTLADRISCSNGLAWDLKEKAFYYVDSFEHNVRRYDYDVETGDISNMKHIFDLKANNIEGAPDGMTIDTDGNLWVAVFNGSCVLHINPKTGKLLQKIALPAKQITSVIFGGKDLDVLYVTSAKLTITEEQKPPCGACFAVTGLGVKGLPNAGFKL
ncbi:hypothetical protein JYU34_017360 [Plutella xylostella]|uniref:Regucalcin n=1 Tax=Plutella xylostella TaxID=51655 RepID=A0ABQ7Q0Z0_PLUXY|nr:hypothetical protein JYU34_017360 [Plutella xylostella]